MNGLKTGDTVSMSRYMGIRGSLNPPVVWVGVVIGVKDPEIYDRCERIVVAWQEGGQSYEKESSLKRLN